MIKKYKNLIQIPNGIWIGDENSRFDLGLNNTIILEECSNYSYVLNRLIALKKDDKIYVFSTNIVTIGNCDTIAKLAEFKAFSDIVYLKVVCEQYIYLIDKNCQTKFSERPHIN